MESIYRAAEHLRELDNKQTGIEYFETFMRYILNAGQKLTNEDVNEIIERIGNSYPEGSEVLMSLAEKLREEGEARGETKILVKTATRLLIKKFGAIPEEIKMKISQLDTLTLELIIDDILEYTSLDDIKKYIQ